MIEQVLRAALAVALAFAAGVRVDVRVTLPLANSRRKTPGRHVARR
jgi:hypothetical protein